MSNKERKGECNVICKKCNSDKVNIQKVSITKRKKKGFAYWFLFGWLLDLLSWLLLTVPRLLIAIFVPKKTKTKVHTEAVCQSCGYSWKV